MGIFTNNISELVQKVLDKEAKIESRIKEINEKINDANSGIKTKTKELIRHELSENVEGQNLCKLAIKELREEIIDLQGLLEAYKNEQSSCSISNKELRKIKEAAIKEREARGQKIETILKEKEDAESQIAQLQKKVERLSNEYSTASNHRHEENELKKILRYVDPRAKQLSNNHINTFITAWLYDGDTEQYYNNFSKR